MKNKRASTSDFRSVKELIVLFRVWDSSDKFLMIREAKAWGMSKPSGRYINLI